MGVSRRRRQDKGAESRSCKQKVRFKTEFEAKKFAKTYGLRTYDCGFCKGWHLSSKDWKGYGNNVG